ncbi:hypothetical protein [Thermaerobacillus caldiproteolyticus]|uniref:hypothetical protein n=1 Tax=Thermaerobacillus caldiproteolyticus TaxID=247480 RepID=UPI0018F16E0A|nr:hypothetical protein [Anoxybacillus caldiproteolyticus]
MKKVSIIASSILLFFVICFGGYKWLIAGEIDGNIIFAGSIAIAYLFNSLTWGDPRGKEKKDELDLHIMAQSAKIAYVVLMILSAAILFVSEGVYELKDIKNIPLLLVVCLTFIVWPVTEFFYSRKYK